MPLSVFSADLTGQNGTPQNAVWVQKWYGWIDNYAPKLYKALKLDLAQVKIVYAWVTPVTLLLHCPI